MEKKLNKGSAKKNIKVSLNSKTKTISGNIFSKKKNKNEQIKVKSGQKITGKIKSFAY